MSEGTCDLSLTGDRGDRVWFTLGLRDTLGVEEGSDLVESFFCDEVSAASLFRRSLERLADEQGLTSDVRAVVTQECLTQVRSGLAGLLNSCYQFDLRGSSRSGASPSAPRTGRAVLNPALFYLRADATGAGQWTASTLDHRRALAYLAGAWQRHGRDGAFHFPGMVAARVDLVRALLTDLGCRNVRQETVEEVVPGGVTIRFEATPELDEWFRKSW